MHRILIGVDLTERAPRVAQWACGFVDGDGTAVLAHVVPGGPVPDFLRSLLESAGRSAVLEEAEARLAGLGESLPCRVEVRTARGRPAPELARLGKDVEADMLAIGPRGGRASRLGTTAEQLVRLADRPVLVVREPRGTAPARLLIAVDASPQADPVLEMGAMLMKRFEARATVLHVLDEDLLVALRVAPEGSADHTMSREAIAATRAWIADKVREHGLPEERTSIAAIFGSPIHEIGGRTEPGGHDLVVMGSRGLGGIGRDILGSVASGVLRAAWCPVLVV